MYNNQKAQNIKQGAFFDYFKCFAFSAAETLRKLERNFHEQFNEDLGLDSNSMLKRVKSLLTGYQVLILQINDSCEFVEIPEFGECLLKIFYQLMAVIKFLAAGIVSKAAQEKPEKERRAVQRYTTVSPALDSKPDTVKQERETIRSREKASHIFKELTQEIKNLEIQTKNVFKQNEETLEKIIKRRQKLQQIESSQSEAILAQTVSLLFKRGEHINNFLNLLQSGQNQYQIKETQTYSKLKELIEEQNYFKIAQAKQKLNHLFKEQIVELQKKKKSAMQSQQVQVKMESDEQGQGNQLRRSQYRKTHVDQTKKMRMEIRMLQDQNNTLKDYIKEKIEEYESITTRLRAEKINLENKLTNLQNNTVKSKGSIDFVKKSQSNFDQYENIDNMSEINSHISLDEENMRERLEGGEKQSFMKKSKVNIAKNIKTKVKFMDHNRNLQILSKIVEFSTPGSSSVIEEPQGIVIHSLTNKSQTNLDLGQIPNIDKNELQEKRHQKFLKRGKSIQRRRSSLQLCKTMLSAAGICNRAWREDNGQLQQLKEKDQIFPKQKNDELVIQSRECLLNIKEVFDKEMKKSRIVRKQTNVQLNQEIKRKEETKEEYKIQIHQEIKKKEESEKENIYESIPQSPHHSNTHQPSRFKSPKALETRTASLAKQGNECTRNKTPQQDQRTVNYGKFNLKLSSNDLIQIFISEENAKNYQILNLSLSIKQKRYFSALGTKAVIKQVKNRKLSKENEQFGQEPKQLSQAINYLSGVILKVLNGLKKQKKAYKKLCNFIRYPHSSIYLSETAEWNSQEEEVSIDYVQLRKLVSRILKLHFECNQVICEHLKYLLRKIGVQLK